MARVEIDQQNASAEAGLSGSKWTDVQLARRALSLSNRNSRVIMRHLLADEDAPDNSLDLRRQENSARISKIIGKLEARCTSAKEKRMLAKIKQARELYTSSYLEALRLLFDGNDRIRAERIMATEVSQGLLRYHAAWTHFIDATLQQMVRLRTQDLVLANQKLQREIVEHQKTENHRHLKTSALKAAANGIVITDRSGTIVWVNPAFCRMTGYETDEVIGKNPRFLASGKQYKTFYANLWQTITSNHVWHGELVNRRKDGTLYTEEMTITPVQDKGEEITHFVAIKQDITQRKSIEEALTRAAEHYRSIVEDAIVGIFQITPEGKFLGVNCSLAKICGYSSAEELLSNVENVGELLVNPSQYQEFAQLIERSDVLHSVETQVHCKDGSTKWLLTNLRGVRDERGEVVRHEGTVQDITERKVAEKSIRSLAYYDPLTGLPNRTLLQDRVTVALAGARRQKTKSALLFLDLDNFKTVNDTLGHAAGDQLLKEVARRLKACVREQDTAARLGGDEFIVVLNGLTESANAAQGAERIVQELSRPFEFEGQPLVVACSVGISVFPEDGTGLEDLMRGADLALYRSKENGRNTFQFFKQEMNAEFAERVSLERSLRTAADQNEFLLVYQPRVEVPTGRIIGSEALLRWRNPERGLVPPDEFMPVAERCGLVNRIGEWVLKTACAQAQHWQQQGLPALPVSVKISPVQFRMPNFVALVRTALRDAGLAPESLELGITEEVMISDIEAATAKMKELSDLGVCISLDDFGTGYSSLIYLKRLPIHKVKIDRSFVRGITSDQDSAAIATSIVVVGRGLGLEMLAEGVETEDQVQFLRLRDCHEMQGHYFSKPLDAEDFAKTLARAQSCAPEPSGVGESTHVAQSERSDGHTQVPKGLEPLESGDNALATAHITL